MNCPSRNDETLEHEGWNQSPPALAADLTTREDLNGTVNRRTDQDSGREAEDTRIETQDGAAEGPLEGYRAGRPPPSISNGTLIRLLNDRISALSKRRLPHFGRRRSQRPSNLLESFPEFEFNDRRSTAVSSGSPSSRSHVTDLGRMLQSLRTVGKILKKFLGFIGPGFMVAVAYIDPGNYSTDVAAGVATQFKLLFIVLMSNIFAIVLQSLAIRLGTVTGMNLAEHCRAHLPRWLNIFLYVIGEAAIIATDIAEVSVDELTSCMSD